MSSLYDFEAATIRGETVTLDKFRGQVLLIVNTASQCGLTPQFEGLEKLYEKFRERGFAVLGFPSNQFAQEWGNNSKIEQFCQMNYGVSFPMFGKVDVNGPSTHPLFEYLKKAAPGILGTQKIKWNFTKFLINRNGEVVKRFAPTVKPEEIEEAIVAELE